jgi:hypothetical protein
VRLEPLDLDVGEVYGYKVTAGWDMALSNAEKQARWRERHLAQRRNAQRIVNILVRKTLTDEHIEAVAVLLNTFLNRPGVRVLRRQLKALSEPSEQDMKQNAAHWREAVKHERDVWLREHPGKTAKDYRRMSEDDLIEWRKAKVEVYYAAEQQAWERDHPGREMPVENCGMSDRDSTDLERWRRQRERKRKRGGRAQRPAQGASPRGPRASPEGQPRA